MRVLGAFAALALLAGGATAGDLERWLPADTLFTAIFDDLPATEHRFRESDWNALWRDPRLAPLLREFDRVEAGAKRDWEKDGKAWPGAFRSAVGGQAVVALVPAGGKPQPVILFERRRGFDLDALAAALPRGRLELHFAGDVVVIAWDEAALRRVAAGPQRRALSDVLAYRALRRRAGPDADVRAYLPRPVLEDLGGWYDGLGEALQLSGAEDIQALGLALTLRERALTTRAFLLVPGKKRGLLRIFGGANTTLEPPPWIPARARYTATLRFDLADLGPLLGETAPGQLEDLMHWTGGRAALSVYRSLGDHFTTVSFGERSPPVLVASVDSPRRIQRVLGAFQRPRIVNGTAVFQARGGAAAIDDRWLMTSESAALVEGLVRWRGVRLGQTDAYRTALAHLPAKRVMVWYAAAPYDKKNPWTAWLRAQAGAVVNDPNGIAVTHVVLLR